MTPTPENDLERLLESTPGAEPPAGLAEKIKAEIPADLATLAAAERGRLLRFPLRQGTILRLAALLAVAAGAFYLVPKTMQDVESDRAGVPVRPLERSTKAPEQPAPPPAPKAQPTSSTELLQKASGEEKKQGQLESTAPAPLERRDAARFPAAPPRGIAGGVSGSALASASSAGSRKAEVASVVDQAAAVQQRLPVGQNEPVAAPVMVTSEAPLVDSRGFVESSAAGSTATRPKEKDQKALRSLGYLGGPAAAKATPVERQREAGPSSDRDVARDAVEDRYRPEPQPYPNPGPAPRQNPVVDADSHPISTFALDVDTGSLTLARGYLERGQVPPRESVRVEEFVNYFRTGEPAPRSSDFSLAIDGAPSPFASDGDWKLLRFHLKAREVSESKRAPVDIVFLIDTSGSMEEDGKMEMVKSALGTLLGELSEDDRVGIVSFANQAHLLVEPTHDLGPVRATIRQLHPGGSTNLADGMRLAYDLAERTFRRGASHKIVLCSDGVANTGATTAEAILRDVEVASRRGIELATVGVGMTEYNDKLLEQLADKGHGAYSYVDNLDEARRIFSRELSGTLSTVAHDAKVQVEFDPRTVDSYRQIGYENRALAARDFRNDRLVAGEVGAGQEVTALYEVKLRPETSRRDRIATFRIRYKQAATDRVLEASDSVAASDLARDWNGAPWELRFAACAARFAELLRGTPLRAAESIYDLVAETDRVADEHPEISRAGELRDLVRRAQNVLRNDP